MADTDDIGLDIWPANAVLCEYMAGHAPLVRNAASILELGSGVGVAGLLTLALGAQSIILTDYDSQVLALLQRNLQLNGFEGRGSVRRIDWRAWRTDSQPDLGSFELLLGADLLYASTVVQDFVQTVKLLLAPHGLLVLVHQIRRSVMKDPHTGLPRLEEHDAPLELFKGTAQSAGLHVRELASVLAERKDAVDGDGSFSVLGIAWQADVFDRLLP